MKSDDTSLKFLLNLEDQKYFTEERAKIVEAQLKELKNDFAKSVN